MPLPPTSQRVSRNTSVHSNQRIREQMLCNIAHCRIHPDQISKRLQELDEEWDVERVLETMAPSVILVGIGLGAFIDRRFLILPAVVAGFFLQHALQGWCPPLPLLRKMGVRTEGEIDEEREALKAIRGDFAEEGSASFAASANSMATDNSGEPMAAGEREMESLVIGLAT